MNVKLGPLKKMIRQDPHNWKMAQKIGAVQFLTWANTGQGKSSKKPPIRFGVLRGSSSAFVGNELVLIFPQTIKQGASEAPTPAQTYAGALDVITFVWNTDYATKMHEWSGGWGPFTRQDGDAGAKWVEDHLKADRNALMAVIGMEYQRAVGL
jgi:hypothetical protein